MTLPLLKGKGKPRPRCPNAQTLATSYLMTWDTSAACAGDAALLFCRFTILRVLTHRQLMGDNTLTVSDALEVYDRRSRASAKQREVPVFHLRPMRLRWQGL